MNLDLKLLSSVQNGMQGNIYDYPAMPRLGHVPNPAASVLLVDTAFSPSLETYMAIPARNGIFPAARSERFAKRHNDLGGNLALIDGDAAFFKRGYLTNTNPTREEKFNPDVIWNPNRENK